MSKSKNRTEVFEGYCPTQKKNERVEQTLHDVTTASDLRPRYIEGIFMCPYILLRGGLHTNGFWQGLGAAACKRASSCRI